MILKYYIESLGARKKHVRVVGAVFVHYHVGIYEWDRKWSNDVSRAAWEGVVWSKVQLKRISTGLVRAVLKVVWWSR